MRKLTRKEQAMIDEKPPIGAEEVAEATAILQKYKAGKAALDKRIVDNELWFRMGHWKNYQNPMMEGKPQPASGWLFNSIANKHADAMDRCTATPGGASSSRAPGSRVCSGTRRPGAAWERSPSGP